MLVASGELPEAGLHLDARRPGPHRARVEEHENAFPPVFDRGQPILFPGDGGAADIGAVLAVNVGHHRLEAGESGQRHHLAQAVHLDDPLDHSVKAATPGPRASRQRPGVKVRIDRNVVAEPLGSGEEFVEFRGFHRPVVNRALSMASDRFQEVGIRMRLDFWVRCRRTP